MNDNKNEYIYTVMISRYGFAGIQAKNEKELDEKVAALKLHDFDWEPLFTSDYCVTEIEKVME